MVCRECGTRFDFRCLKKLSVIYRYILQNKDSELVSLQDELIFTEHYMDLQAARFGDSLQIRLDVPPPA